MQRQVQRTIACGTGKVVQKKPVTVGGGGRQQDAQGYVAKGNPVTAIAVTKTVKRVQTVCSTALVTAANRAVLEMAGGR